MAVCIILVLILATLSLPVVSLNPQVKYVQPFNGSNSCINELCTFDHYAHDPEQHFISDTTFIFLPGEHQLNSSINLYGVQNVSFQGMLTEEPVIIKLGPLVGLNFSNCDGIEIKSLNFLLGSDYEYGLMFYDTSDTNLQSIVISTCTEDENSTRRSAVLSQASEMNISNSSFVGISGQFGAALLVLDSSNISFMGTNTFTNNSAKLGGAIHSISSTLQFDGISIFKDNRALLNMHRSDMSSYSDDVIFDSGIGGAVYVNNSQFIMTGCSQFLINSATNLGGAVAALNDSVVVINGSACNSSSIGMVFDGNYVTSKAEFPFNAIGSGGAIYTNHSIANITNISLLNNSSPMHGGAAYFVQSDVSLINIFATDNKANKYYGGAVRFYQCTQAHISGENSFISNIAKKYGGAIDFCDMQSLKIAGLNYFEGNVAENGGAFDAYNILAVLISGDIKFKYNGNRSDNSTSSGGAVYVFSSTLSCTGNMEYENNIASVGGAISSYSGHLNFYADTLFRSNHAESSGGAIYSSHSRITYYGHGYNETNKIQESINKFQFESNTANYGGAIAIYGTGKLILNPNVEIDFTENQAQTFGGAIFVDIFTSSECLTETADTTPECFIQLNTCYSAFIINPSQFVLKFTYNDAGKRGNILYGGWLNECKWLFKTNAECGTSRNEEPAFEIVKKISRTAKENDFSYMFSSKPNSICICNESSIDHCWPPVPISISPDRHCGSPVPMTVSPGGTFTVALLTIDQYSNPIDGVEVMSNQVNTGDYRIDHSTIITNSSYQFFSFCVLVHNESLVKEESQLNFSLYIDPDGQCKDITHFNITVQPCPLGFEFSSDVRKCNCGKELQKFTEDCNIEKMTIGRSSNNVWIKFTNNYILYHDGGCPLDYCSNTKVSISQNNPDIQCNDGRTGKLCGNCMENYSLALGSLVCKQNCSDGYLALILPIGALGVLLIVLLFLLRLTVAVGTINGLLFYANIVQANHQIFLPMETTNRFKYFYTIFMGWLNLDFGIETCFYDRMDIIAYSWLQFLFPVYLWILMLIIIVSAHYSHRVAKNLGQNPVAVLATVLLISYGKLLKAIIVPLSWAELKNIPQENNHTEIVWFYNGSTPYFADQHHISLVVFASLVLVFLFLPYSFLLLCGHLIQAKSHWRIFSWINKLKPFMDAYHGPYKKNERHWIGLFLLARCTLFLTFIFDAAGLDNHNLNLLIITSVTAGLSIIKGRVYEKWYNDFLESSFLLNLSILSIATFYVQSTECSGNPCEVIEHQSIVSSVSVGIAFIYFIGIVVFHIHQRMRELDLFDLFQSVYRRYKLHLKRKSNKKAQNEQSMEMITKSSVCLRELLLEDETHT